jgi:CxxC motif-containing protein (DUF1111 family)
LALALGAAAAAHPLGDPALPVLPLSDDQAARATAARAAPPRFDAPEPYEANPAGAATTAAPAFGLPAANLPASEGLDFRLGEALFDKIWVAAPSSTRASDGLGPYHNPRACADCHLNDGRGLVSDNGRGLVAHLSVPGGSPPPGIADWHSTLPDPTYGRQLQDRAAPGLAAEGRLSVTWTAVPVTLADGTTVTLRRPAYALADLAGGPLDRKLLLSPRVGPPLIGLGLLEAIPAADILALEDPTDANGDGISGRAQIVPAADGTPVLGRFGWKAGQPSLRAQTAAAFSADLGLSTPLFPDPWGDCTEQQPACRAGPHGQDPGLRDGLEVDGASLDLVTLYLRNLGVPARRGLDTAPVLRGKATFHALGCAGCHVPRHVTHRLDGRPGQSFQLIWPYTDLLLHDMGPGLADARPEARASGSEWRTPPLWGLGLTGQVGGTTQFLHDGRALSLAEAILWHGGEAQAARDGFAALPADSRAALIAFLESL